MVTTPLETLLNHPVNGFWEVLETATQTADTNPPQEETNGQKATVGGVANSTPISTLTEDKHHGYL